MVSPQLGVGRLSVVSIQLLNFAPGTTLLHSGSILFRGEGADEMKDCKAGFATIGSSLNSELPPSQHSHHASSTTMAIVKTITDGTVAMLIEWTVHRCCHDRLVRGHTQERGQH